MKQPDFTTYKQLKVLTEKKISFALYRMPWTDEPLMAVEDSKGVALLRELKELNGRQGFLVAPFKVTENCPIVLIENGQTYKGWEEIARGLEESTAMVSGKEGGCNPDVKAEVKTEKEMKEQYRAAFGRFIGELQRGTFSKLVLSRNATFDLPERFPPLDIFLTACNRYPRMMISYIYTPYTGTWIGSSPEIIVSGSNDNWQTVALAGTMPIEGDEVPTDWSRKNREEQAYVSDYIGKVLERFATEVSTKGPYTARAGQLAHLKTEFSFRLKEGAHLGDLLEALHPTPAVCGLPKDEAYDFITHDGSYDRKYYSGVIGEINPRQTTSLYVNLRCMHIHNQQTTLYAGGGLLPSSVMEGEWEETRHKMNTMRKCLDIL